MSFLNDTVRLNNGEMGIRSKISVRALGKSAASEGPTITFIASDDTLDRDHEVVKAEGWVLENYRRNPVFQNAHQYGDIIHTLGRAINVDVVYRNGRAALQMRIMFAVDANPVAKIAYDLYAGGFLNAVSVGFLPLEWQTGNGKNEPRRLFTKMELLELSAVAVPANPNALMTGKGRTGGGTSSAIKACDDILGMIQRMR